MIQMQRIMNDFCETVVLLHGLARSSASMSGIEKVLKAEGYRVCNLTYPSRHYPVDVLAEKHVAPVIRSLGLGRDNPVHFVTHSMGGIILRELVSSGAVTHLGRAVMLGPPNEGSEIVDKLGKLRLFRTINGPAGVSLGTHSPHSVPKQLGPAAFDLGIIAGTASLNPLLSLLLPGENDGKVTVASTRLEGMRDFITLPCSHTLMMKDPRVLENIVSFLRSGFFLHQPQATATRK